MSGTPGSGIVSTADDFQELIVVRGVRAVGGAGEMCMYLAQAG